MENITVNNSAVMSYAMTGIVSILLPFLLAFLWKRSSNEGYYAAIIGFLGFLAAGTVRILARAMLLNGGSPLKKSALAFYVTNAVISGVLEETSRLLCFKYLLKNKTARSVSVMHGIGHGAYETVVLVGIGSFDYVSYLNTLKSGGVSAFITDLTAEETANTIEWLKAIAGYSFGTGLLATLDSISGVVFHIAMSVIVFAALQQIDWKKLFLLAVGMHIVADIVPYFEFIGAVGMEALRVFNILLIMLFGWIAYRKYQELSYA